MTNGVSLYPHQQEAIEKLKNGSILCGGVGTGKSRTAIAYYYINEGHGQLGMSLAPMSIRVPLYIITTARKRDTDEWESELYSFGLSSKQIENSQVPVAVDSWNNIRKYTGISNAFFIFDEQRVVSFGAWSKAFVSIARKNHWILLTATPGDDWMDYISVFIANGFYKNKTDFIRTHVVYSKYSKYPRVDRYINTGRLNRQRQMITVNMKYEKKTIPHKKNILVDYDHELFDLVKKKRWNYIEERPVNNISELCQLMRRVSNSSEDRLVKLKELILKHPKSIIFYNFNYELDLIKTMMDGLSEDDYEYSEWNGHKHEQIPKSDKWVYLVQYTAGAEGWNCVETDTIIFFSQNYSYKVMVQSAGRIDRLNTKFVDLYYFYLISNSFIDKAILQALRKKKNFNESCLKL